MFNEVFNLCCDLELEHSEAMFSQDSLPYDVPSEKWKQKDQQFSHTKSGYKRFSSSAIPSLVTKGSAVQKISKQPLMKF